MFFAITKIHMYIYKSIKPYSNEHWLYTSRADNKSIYRLLTGHHTYHTVWEITYIFISDRG